MHACYRYSESSIVSELSRLYKKRFGNEGPAEHHENGEDDLYTEVSREEKPSLDLWLEQFALRNASDRRRSGKNATIHSEYATYFS
eukprot:IDg4698t1